MHFVSQDDIGQSRLYNEGMAGRPPTKEAPAFGAKLAALRQAQNWTQPILAEKLGISLAAVVHYERKATNPSGELLSKVASLFNVTVDELLDQQAKPKRKPGPASRLERLTEQLASLPKQKQKAVVEILEGYLKATANGHRLHHANGH